MFCKKCGHPLPEGTKFCGACGTPVQLQSDNVPYTAPVDLQPEIYTAPFDLQPEADTPSDDLPPDSYSIPLIRPQDMEPIPVQQPLPVHRTVPVQPAAPQQNSAPAPKKPRSGRKLLPVVGVLAVAVLAVVLLLALFGGKTVYLVTQYEYSNEIYKCITESTFNEDGDIVEYSYTLKYKDPYSSYYPDYSYGWSYEYEDGRIVCAEYESDGDSFELEYSYDRDGNLETVEGDGFEGEVSCDQEGRITEMEFTGPREESVECSYYDNGYIKELEYTKNGLRYVDVYYETGKIREHTLYNMDGKVEATTYVYDNHGRETETETKRYSGGEVRSTTLSTYEYDKDGNIIAYTEKRTSNGSRMTLECECTGDDTTRKWVITKLTGDEEEFSSIMDALKKGDTYRKETFDDAGNRIERITYLQVKYKETWEYLTFRAPRGFINPGVSAPQYCQFLA